MKHAVVGRALRALVLAAVVAGATSLARAAESVTCWPTDGEEVHLDGLTDEWHDLAGAAAGGPGRGVEVKCQVDARTVYLLLDVRDDYLVRTPKTRPGEDHLTLTLGARRLVIYPGDARAIPTRVLAGGRAAPRVRGESALQEYGWAVELSLPLAELPGARAGTPLPLHLRFDDCDSKATLMSAGAVELDGHLAFAASDATLEAFLKDRGLKRDDVYFDRALPRGGRALLAGRYLAIVADGYVYRELPVRGRGDVKEARVVDLAGDGRAAVVVRYVERGAGGSREVLSAWRPAGESEIERLFAAEVAKSLGAARIDSQVSFVKRGRATDIVIAAGRASGTDAANWHEAPADDMVPILLPWADERRARFQFTGNEYRRTH